MKTLCRTFTLSMLAFALVPGSSWADWEAKLVVKSLSSKVRDAGGISGRIWVSGDRRRVEMQLPRVGPMVILGEGRKAYVLNTAKKTYTEMTRNSSGAGQPEFPTCARNSSGTVDAEGCLRDQGFRSIGTETINGHQCKTYEAQVKRESGPITVRLWRLTESKELAFLRMTSTAENGMAVQMDVEDLKEGPLARDLFELPKDYVAEPHIQAEDLDGGELEQRFGKLRIPKDLAERHERAMEEAAKRRSKKGLPPPLTPQPNPPHP